MMMALITNRKKPRVKKVIGIVKIVKTGLTTALRKAKTIATSNAETKPFTSIPGNNLAVIITATAEIRILAKNFTKQNYPIN